MRKRYTFSVEVDLGLNGYAHNEIARNNVERWLAELIDDDDVSGNDSCKVVLLRTENQDWRTEFDWTNEEEC